MKKYGKIVIIGLIFALVIAVATITYAASEIDYIDRGTTSELIALRENGESLLDEYIERFGGSRTYGTVAFILSQVRWFSIPICFLGLAVRSNV